MIDAWKPQTFDNELRSTIDAKSELVIAYWQLNRQLMNEHINSNPYQSLKPNHLASDYCRFQEQQIAPLFEERRVRVLALYPTCG